ncbi:hypothetical protein [Wenjunlia tyrosinilytica]|uniref:Uncharacterized protein n=1 Tax=Wenjunlia tyrosinilytica TaxID=1544741 RepID=A0A917ZWN2_9ACTN|nr:hypothetical protein [Wenjunlia tyrosinilytica]GGO97115.1 hypothetical protein GCM10012280_58150 [Wenjunlia tyrosinilytica]
MNSKSRMCVLAGTFTAAVAVALLVPTGSAASLTEVNGHTDNWVNEGAPSAEYDNGYKVDSQSEVRAVLDQCNNRSVSCASTTVGTPTQVTKWFDVDNTGTGTGPIEACGLGEGEISQSVGGSHTFTWGWNVGAAIDITLIKEKLGLNLNAQYNESHTEAKSGDVRMTVKKGEKGMLKLGYDMERKVADVTVQGGKFGGAKISGLRMEIPLKGGMRVGTDVVPCGGTLLNGR